MDSFSSIIATALMVIGGLRAVFVPVVAAINMSIAKSSSKEDDAKWLKIKDSLWFLIIQNLLNFATGTKVKVPEKK